MKDIIISKIELWEDKTGLNFLDLTEKEKDKLIWKIEDLNLSVKQIVYEGNVYK